jgi:drug/metabolite transporter (DMT)-like permease
VIGGAYTDGGLQNLLNQCNIPGTILLSYWFLGETVSKTQGLGSIGIILGTSVSILPALLNPSQHSTTTVSGVLIYLLGIVPSCASNVYKEAAFRTSSDLHVDIYLLSTIVSVFQVLFGFLFIPILALPGFGGIPLSEIPHQMTYGFQCFLGQSKSYKQKVIIIKFEYVFVVFVSVFV